MWRTSLVVIPVLLTGQSIFHFLHTYKGAWLPFSPPHCGHHTTHIPHLHGYGHGKRNTERIRALQISRNADLVHPTLPLAEAFINDAVDGDQAARYLLETYSEDGLKVGFPRFLNDCNK
ncbi:hypothetical protein MBM_02788 [Drepanopeziza brunnea f. sp. 'multigermtubi' MB_m1]|uniref:Uncharacterized protein n=1 Tax=Marssonina brunnea f. sp. multigermtubi (strain MB_m1) TaxID=1072389 RepID=K1X2V8_MARBU|nr:uncharacterized protein MBM_02788 [Drepanopeziza brunnea f. sp. 'multigermtubi' MB_m1]EKD19551.1 hypothetical protein MBM_02788 [Drepanopeziza brunnea f. sp. 'multigermtubi' MB_m1]